MSNSVKKNITYNFAYQILILILPFITAPYLSRTIGANGIGVFSFSQSVVSYFSLLTLLGLQNYGNRSIAAVQNDKKKRSQLFFEIYAMQIGMFFTSIVLYTLYNFFFSVDIKASVLMSIWLFSSLFDVNWFLFGMEKFKLTVIRNSIIKISTVICIFVFVRKDTDVYLYILIMASGMLLSQLSLWPFILKLVSWEKPSLKNILLHFRPNLILFVPVLAASVYNVMDKIMLGYMTDMAEVGFYENAEKIIKMIQSLIVAIGTVMLPRVTSLFATSKDNLNKKYFDIVLESVLAYVCIAFFGILSISNNFVGLYFGKGFEKTGILLNILIVTVFFFGVGNVLRTQFLIPKKYDQIFVKSALWGAAINLIANLFLIPKYASNGAAISTIFAESFVCFYQFYKVKNEINIFKYIVPFISFSLCGLLMYFSLSLVPSNLGETLQLAVKCIIISIFSIALFFVELKRIKKKLCN